MTQPQQPQTPPPAGEKKDFSYQYESRRERRHHHEGDWDEGWRHDRWSPICWALSFIWAGLVLIAETSGWGRSTFAWWTAWPVIRAGAGAIFVLCGLIRLFVPHRWPSIGGIVFGLILLGIGLGVLTSWGIGLIAAIALIAVGLIIILRGMVWHRR